MVKSRIFDNTQLLKEHPELPHYKEEVVCFRSEYKDRSYPANECYFNRGTSFGHPQSDPESQN